MRQGAAFICSISDKSRGFWLVAVSEVDPEMRVRFTSPHPKDFSDDVLDVIRERPNVTSWIHMPAQVRWRASARLATAANASASALWLPGGVRAGRYDMHCYRCARPPQSGSTTVLERMRRGYTREAYDALVERIQGRIPFASISTDMIVGFCGETEEEHQVRGRAATPGWAAAARASQLGGG